MKYFFILSFLVMGLIGCQNEKKKDLLDPSLVTIPKSADGSNVDLLPKFQFEKESHNFENIFQGEKVSYTFKFQNIGNSDLIISNAKASCGCTVPEFSKEPVPAGGTGYVTITFDSKGRQGMQKKTVTVMANTIPNTKRLTITGYVISK